MISITDLDFINFDFTKWFDYFINSFYSVCSYFLNDILTPIVDVLFSSKLVVFTASIICCAAVSAIVYIIINSRSDSFDDCYFDSRISTPNMYSHVSDDVFSFGYSRYKYHRNKKEMDEFFKNNPSFIYMTRDGVKFFAKDWNKRSTGKKKAVDYKAMERYFFATQKKSNSNEKNNSNIDVSAD